VTIALRTQQIIATESGVTDIVDPLAGSYAVEQLTDEIEAKAAEYIEKIESIGGAIKAIEAGFMQNEILNSAYAYQRAIENKDLVIVGLNEFVTEAEPLRDILKIDPEVERYQKEKLARVKEERDLNRINTALEALREAAEGNGNIVPPVLDAVKAYATVGEISDTLRGVFGEYRES
jgi:methylmalonyl-CoA mutase N-terminal domain/subunit